jgi:hypothetical protein
MASQREWEKRIWRYLATELESLTHEELVDQIADRNVSEKDQERIVDARGRVQDLIWNKA